MRRDLTLEELQFIRRILTKYTPRISTSVSLDPYLELRQWLVFNKLKRIGTGDVSE